MMLRGEPDRLSKQLGMDAVGSMRAQARTPANLTLGLRQMLPGKVRGGGDSFESWGDQFQKDGRIARCVLKRFDRPVGLRDLTKRGRAAPGAFAQPTCDHSITGNLSTMGHNLPNPGDHRDARRAQRACQVAQFQMNVCVDQTRQDRHIAQALGIHVGVRPNGNDAPIGHRHDTVGQRWAGDGKDIAGAIGLHGGGIRLGDDHGASLSAHAAFQRLGSCVVNRLLQCFFRRPGKGKPRKPDKNRHCDQAACCDDLPGINGPFLGSRANQPAQHRPAMQRLGRNARNRNHKRVVNEMKDDARQDTAALDGHESDHDAHHTRDDRLLNDRMDCSKEDRTIKDGSPLVAQVPEAGQDESAKGQLFTERCDDGHHQQQLPEAGPRHFRLQICQRSSHFVGDGIKPHDCGMQHGDNGMNRNRKQRYGRYCLPSRPLQQKRLSRTPGEQPCQYEGRCENAQNLCYGNIRERQRNNRAQHELNQQDDYAAADRACRHGCRLTVAPQMAQPRCNIKSLAFPKQNRFGIELLHSPANGQPARANCHGKHDRAKIDPERHRWKHNGFLV